MERVLQGIQNQSAKGNAWNEVTNKENRLNLVTSHLVKLVSHYCEMLILVWTDNCGNVGESEVCNCEMRNYTLEISV